MPLALFALTIAAYAIGTTEFVIVGLLSTVATDLNITLPLAGLIVSVYALGVTFGAPVLTALTGGIGRKKLLVGLMALFTLGNVAAAIAPNYEMLLVARVLAAFAHGVFFSVGSTIAADLVPELTGAALGRALRRAESAWIDSDFTLTRVELLALAHRPTSDGSGGGQSHA